MTMAGEPADDDALADVFGSEREDRGGKEPAPVPQATDDQGQPRDEHGRFAAKSQGEQQGQQPPEQQQQAAPEPTEPPVDPNANRQVPLSELLSERKKFKSREEELSRLQVEADARAKAYEQQLQQFMQQQRQPPPQTQQQIEPPDPLTDPEGYFRHMQQQFQTQLLNQKLDTSELLARRQYGAQAVDEAFQAANQAGVIGNFIRDPDPYGSLVEWHKKQKALAEFGDDPAAYKQRLEEEIRQKVLAELKAGGANGQPQQQRFPSTLAAATATGPQGAVLDEATMMGDIFGSGRRNRRS